MCDECANDRTPGGEGLQYDAGLIETLPL